MLDDFERELRAIQPGQRTGIFTTPLGYHIAKLHSFESDRLATFEEACDDIQRTLTLQSEHQTYLRKMEGMRRGATITRVPDAGQENGQAK